MSLCLGRGAGSRYGLACKPTRTRSFQTPSLHQHSKKRRGGVLVRAERNTQSKNVEQGIDADGKKEGPDGEVAGPARTSIWSKLNIGALFKRGGPPNPKQDQWLLSMIRYCAIVLFALSLGREAMISQARNAPKEVLYSDFITMLDARSVRAARMESGTSRIYFEVRPTEEAAQEGEAKSTSRSREGAVAASTTTMAEAPAVAPGTGKSIMSKQFYVKIADKNDAFLISHILKSGVEFGVVKASFLAAVGNVFLTALALWVPLMPLIFILQRMVEGSRGSRKQKKNNSSVANARVTFADVAGVENAKEELAEVVLCLKDASRYKKLNAKMPSGVLLCGPPGTGKTLLAKAVAGEAGVPFMAVSASEFVELFVGRGAARIRELFAEARKSAPCVVFIDELDAVGSRRGLGYNDERDQTLNQLLTELDGFEGRQGVLLLAATNRPDVLDPALLRPGRLSRKVVVPPPDEEGRQAILGVHLRKVPMESEEAKAEACIRVARLTGGFSGAELANVVNEGALLAARRGLEVVSIRELIEGVQRTKFGVDGRGGPQGGFTKALSSWLMDLAVGPERKPVKVQPVG